MTACWTNVARAAAAAVAIGTGVGHLAEPASVAARSTYTVNTIADADGPCDPLEFGDCSLREAIKAASATPGGADIAFAIPGDGVHAIRPLSPLPAVGAGVVIDGYTQPGARPNTAAKGTNARITIEIDGSQASGRFTSGLVLGGGNATVRGVAVTNWSFMGISMRDGGDNVVAGCFVGTDASGTAAKGNAANGVYVGERSARNRIGGPDPADRNLISGNQGSANPAAIRILTDVNVVQNNLIGVDRSGAKPLPNAGAGVWIQRTANRVVGNVIAFNAGNGVWVTEGAGNTVDRNAIFRNGADGIDINNLEIKPNDPGDGDGGANGGQNNPVLRSAAAAGRKTVVKGNLNSRPDREYVVQFYADAKGDPEGRVFLGEQRVTTDADGNAAFAFATRKPLKPGQVVTATATDGEGSTSEFSDPVAVRAARKR
jgi:CSLREA domain-containing protein